MRSLDQLGTRENDGLSVDQSGTMDHYEQNWRETCKENQANQISVDLALDQSYEGLQRYAETELKGERLQFDRLIDDFPLECSGQANSQGLSRQRIVQAQEPNGARFFPNPPRRRGGETTQGRVSRDATAFTIRAQT
jgi:hypothetical protein